MLRGKIDAEEKRVIGAHCGSTGQINAPFYHVLIAQPVPLDRLEWAFGGNHGLRTAKRLALWVAIVEASSMNNVRREAAKIGSRAC